MKKVYPRACGGTMVANQASTFGDSLKVYPRACGGNPESMGAKIKDCEGVYPRACGGTLQATDAACVWVRVGSIPAPAGER